MTLTGTDREVLAELAPVLRRAVTLNPRSLVRLRLGAAAASVLARLPFGVLVARTVETAPRADRLDVAVRAAEALSWLDGENPDPPLARDAEWRSGLPPTSGWMRVETVPDHVVRSLVRSGALALQEAGRREGVPGAQPRAEVADVLLDSTVLAVSDDSGRTAEVTLRMLSALTRMGFLPRDGRIFIDVAGRWIRVVAEYGTVYRERPGGLVVR